MEVRVSASRPSAASPAGAINGDLTHSVKAPEDLTLELMRDVGWFADADTEGIPDDQDNCPNDRNADQADYDGDRIGLRLTVLIGSCDSGAPNAVFPDGSNIMDRLPGAIAAARNHGQFIAILNQHLNEAKGLGLLSGAEKGAIDACAAQSSLP